MIKLKNLRKSKPEYPWDVKVDRTSPLGNPFKDGGRQGQCDRYERYFEDNATTAYAMHSELVRLYKLHEYYGRLRLFCWCVPLRCHSETIKKFLDQYIIKKKIKGGM